MEVVLDLLAAGRCVRFDWCVAVNLFKHRTEHGGTRPANNKLTIRQCSRDNIRHRIANALNPTARVVPIAGRPNSVQRAIALIRIVDTRVDVRQRMPLVVRQVLSAVRLERGLNDLQQTNRRIAALRVAIPIVLRIRIATRLNINLLDRPILMRR